MNDPGDFLYNNRKDYGKDELNETKVAADPVDQFSIWFKMALEGGIAEPHAMTLATVDAEGKPTSRIVLLRYYDINGFVFYTNYRSAKGQDLLHNNYAALNFFWPALERQVRIEGIAEKTDPGISDKYFATRPRESQLGAWASKQSKVLRSREELTGEFLKLKARFEDKEIPRPPHWGGYNVKPVMIEFWQGRPDRLHDRIRYLSEKDHWKIERLSP